MASREAGQEASRLARMLGPGEEVSYSIIEVPLSKKIKIITIV